MAQDDEWKLQELIQIWTVASQVSVSKDIKMS